MDTSLTEGKGKETPSVHYPSTTVISTETKHTDMSEAAKDADIMMRMIVGSISPDPDEIQRGLDMGQTRKSTTSGKEINMGLVILSVALVILVFALDLVFLKM
jgi:hypothetical protein